MRCHASPPRTADSAVVYFAACPHQGGVTVSAALPLAPAKRP